MNLNQLQYFAMTVEHGSYAAAARREFVSPPAISRSIGELERELNVQLVERVGRNVKPTAFGSVFYLKVLDVLAEAESLRTLAHLPFKGKGGKLSVAVATSADGCRYMRIDLIRKALTELSNLTTSIMLSSNGSCLSALEEGVVDAAVVLGRALKPDLVATRLFSVRFGVVVSTQNPLSGRKEISLSEFDDSRVAVPCELGYLYPLVASAFRQGEIAPLFKEVNPGVTSYSEFIESGGVFFAAEDPDMGSFYPDAVFVRVREDLSLPVSFVTRKDCPSYPIAAVQQCLLSTAKTFRI